MKKRRRQKNNLPTSSDIVEAEKEKKNAQSRKSEL